MARATLRRRLLAMCVVVLLPLLLIIGWYFWPFAALSFGCTRGRVRLALLDRGRLGRRVFLDHLVKRESFRSRVWGLYWAMGLGARVWEGERDYDSAWWYSKKLETAWDFVVTAKDRAPVTSFDDEDLMYLKTLDLRLFYFAVLFANRGKIDAAKWGRIPAPDIVWILHQLRSLDCQDWNVPLMCDNYLRTLPDQEALAILLSLDKDMSSEEWQDIGSLYQECRFLRELCEARLLDIIERSKQPDNLWREWAEQYSDRLAFQWVTCGLLQYGVILVDPGISTIDYARLASRGQLRQKDVEVLLGFPWKWRSVSNMQNMLRYRPKE